MRYGLKWSCHCDNKAAISMALNPVQRERSKHMEIDRHFIREKVEEGTICLTFLPTHLQAADVLTKRQYLNLRLKAV